MPLKLDQVHPASSMPAEVPEGRLMCAHNIAAGVPAELTSLQARRMRHLLKLVALDRILAKRKASYTVLVEAAALRQEPGGPGSWPRGHIPAQHRAVQGWPQPSVGSQQAAQHAVGRHGAFLQQERQLPTNLVPDCSGVLAVTVSAGGSLGHQIGGDQLAGRQVTHPLCSMQQGAQLGQQSPAQLQTCPQGAAEPQQAGELPSQQGPVQLPLHQPPADAVTAQPAGAEPAEQSFRSSSSLPESDSVSMHLQPQTSPMQHQLPGRLPPLRLPRQGHLSQPEGVSQTAASTSQDLLVQQAMPGEHALTACAETACCFQLPK